MMVLSSRNFRSMEMSVAKLVLDNEDDDEDEDEDENGSTLPNLVLVLLLVLDNRILKRDFSMKYMILYRNVRMLNTKHQIQNTLLKRLPF